ncbi:MAG: YbhB/YbcL family Raf kinase inhibitor-like protein, partial [Bdellovibrionia bacterium]
MLILSSPQFHDGDQIPVRYTGLGQNVSPPLRWSGIPKNTVDLALICDDPDAPGPEAWVHWVIYSLSPIATSGLAEGVPTKPLVVHPVSAAQGINSFEKYGYGGPLPPPGHGAHRYFFKLYALDFKLPLKPGLTKTELLEKMANHIVADTQLMGRFEQHYKP